MVPYLSSNNVPPTWSQLRKGSKELSMDAQFDSATR